MSFEYIVGLQVDNDDLYAQYRVAMLPILKTFGGGFRYDFRIDEVLKSEVAEPMNRVFAIYFEDDKARDLFFSDGEYLKIKTKFYTPAVSATTIISEYSR
jgi:uncharacterized protein (DUF1330 family)